VLNVFLITVLKPTNQHRKYTRIWCKFKNRRQCHGSGSSCQPLLMEAQVQSKESPCGICGGQSSSTTLILIYLSYYTTSHPLRPQPQSAHQISLSHKFTLKGLPHIWHSEHSLLQDASCLRPTLKKTKHPYIQSSLLSPPAGIHMYDFFHGTLMSTISLFNAPHTPE
jgi:hypothetical protein